MTAYSLGDAAARALGRLAGARPARRGSQEAGTFEDAFFAVPAKGETDRLLRIARATLDAGRRLRRDARRDGRVLTGAAAQAAALTAGAVRVYEELLTLARLNAGRVFPSYDRLAAVTGLGRATVARGLAVLEATGFLVRQRRFRRPGRGARRPPTPTARCCPARCSPCCRARCARRPCPTITASTRPSRKPPRPGCARACRAAIWRTPRLTVRSARRWRGWARRSTGRASIMAILERSPSLLPLGQDRR